MDRKINSYGAITFVALISLFLGVLLWNVGKKQSKEMSLLDGGYVSGVSIEKEDTQIGKQEGKIETECKTRIFKGEEKIKVWYTDEKNEKDDSPIVVVVATDDIRKLPEKNLSNQERENFMIEIADAPLDVLEKIKHSSKNNPAEITVKGYLKPCSGISIASTNQPEESFK